MKIKFINKIVLALVALAVSSTNVFSYPQKTLRDINSAEQRNAVTLLKKRPHSKITRSPGLINRLRLIFSSTKTKKTTKKSVN